jgi:hypothetical protein
MFWTPRVLGFEYMIKLRGNDEYHPKRMEKSEFLLPNPYEKLWVNIIIIIAIWKCCIESMMDKERKWEEHNRLRD